MQIITNIAIALLIKDDFLEITSIFGKKRQLSISHLNKIYVKPVKKQISRFAFYFLIVILINVFSYMLLDLNVIMFIFIASLVFIIYHIKFMKTIELNFELSDKKTFKIQLPFYLKSETIDIIRSIRNKINSKI